MKRILWVSDLVLDTGFSRVSHSIIDEIKDKYEIIGMGINYFGDPHKRGIDVYPAFIGNDVYGFQKLPILAKNLKPDLIFILNDAWVINNYLKVLKSEGITNIPIITYIPVDGENHSSQWYKHFDIVYKVVTYTNFGKRVIESVLDREVSVIPHGVNKAFHKMDIPKKELREEFFKTDRFNDDFIILNANRNQPRKRIDLTMLAFKYFAEGKDNVKLYLHCGLKDSSIDIVQLADYLGISDKLIYSNTAVGVQRVSVEDLNKIYNATDIGVNTSWGEGWGLVGVEHLSCGKPQIASTYSAFPEALGEGAIYVEPAFDIFVDNTNVLGKLVYPQDVAKAMDILYSNKEVYDELSKKGFEYVNRPEFKWENIAKRFEEIFMEVL